MITRFFWSQFFSFAKLCVLKFDGCFGMDVVVERTSSLSLILFQPDHAKVNSKRPEEL